MYVSIVVVVASIEYVTGIGLYFCISNEIRMDCLCERKRVNYIATSFQCCRGGYSSVHVPMLLTFWTQSFVFVLLLIRKREITHILISYTQSSYKVHSDFFYYRRVKVYLWRLFNCLRCNRLSLYTYTAHLNTRRKVSP